MVTFQCYMEFVFDGCCHVKIICFYEWILKVESNLACRGNPACREKPSLLLYSTLLYSTLLYSTLLYSTLLYSTLLYSTLLYSTLLYSTLLYILLYSTLSMGHATFFFSMGHAIDSKLALASRQTACTCDKHCFLAI